MNKIDKTISDFLRLSSQNKFAGFSLRNGKYTCKLFRYIRFLTLTNIMTSEAIGKQVESENDSEIILNIHFKQRNTIRGLFIKGNDYKDLKSKNLWRIVTNTNIELWRKTKDVNLARIFNGVEFTRLSED